MTLRDFNLRPSMKDVAGELGKLAQDPADKAMNTSALINEEKVKGILGELWPEFVEMVHSNKGKLDDWIKDAVQKGEEVNGYGQNGEPEIIVKDGYADSLGFGIFYKGIPVVDIKLVVKQEYGGLDLVYLNPALRGNRWGPRFALKAIQYFKKFGKDKIRIVISEHGRTYWRDKIKLERTVGYIYPIDTVRKKIEGYLKDNAQVSPDPGVTSIQAPGGIDLTAKRMKLEVDSDKGAVNQPLGTKALENIEINGLYIKDIAIKPLKNLPEMLGIPAP